MVREVNPSGSLSITGLFSNFAFTCGFVGCFWSEWWDGLQWWNGLQKGGSYNVTESISGKWSEGLLRIQSIKLILSAFEVGSVV